MSILRRYSGLLVLLICSTAWGEVSATAPESSNPENDSFRYSPVLGINAIQPIFVGLEISKKGRPLRIFSEIGYAYIPFGSSRYVGAFSVQGGVRYNPWKNWFFGSAALGFRYLSVTADMSTFKIEEIPQATSGSINISSVLLNLAIGGNFRVSPKLFLGFDVGLQIPLAAAGNLYLENKDLGTNSNMGGNLDTDSTEVFGHVAYTVLPQVTLIRLTWVVD